MHPVPAPRVAVVGHAEWVTFLRVPALPRSGEIVHAPATWEAPGGSGAMAAALLAEGGARPALVTALGDDPVAERIRARLESLGVTVVAEARPEPHRRATALIDPQGERTLVVHGNRMEPRGARPPEGAGAVLLGSGDAAAARAARRAPLLVAMAQAARALGDVVPDVLVASAGDPVEVAAARRTRAGAVLLTRGEAGGTWWSAEDRGAWEAAPPPAAGGDAYGCGDAFAAALTLALARGAALGRAVEAAAAAAAQVRARDGGIPPLVA